MTYGITGNTTKSALWEPLVDLLHWLDERDRPYVLHRDISSGLIERELMDPATCAGKTVADLADACDVVLSFGGDGTILRYAHEIGQRATPMLGINIGRLGFLADITVDQVRESLDHLERGTYRIEERMVLAATLHGDEEPTEHWALNEVAINRSGREGLIAIDVSVDGIHLNTYWSDGLLIATPTGSTAYSLSAMGPLIMPGCNALVLTPLAPHTLTVRPIVIPDHCTIELSIDQAYRPFSLALDGFGTTIESERFGMTITRADHAVHLVKLPEQHYFKTIRTKLMWGKRNSGKS